MNQIYEYGSSLDIYVRAKNPITIGDKHYDQDEVCLVLRDVGVQFNFAANSTEMKSIVPVYKGVVDGFPQSITTSYIPLTSVLSNFLFEAPEAAQFVQKIEKRTANSAGKIMLLGQPVECKPMFVYGAKGKEKGWNYDATTKSIINLTPDTAYSLHYFTELNGTAHSLRERFLPYFEIEMVGKGNTNKFTSAAHLIVPTVKIDSSPNLIFVDDGQLSIQLTFNIIYKGQNEPYMIFE